MNIKNQLTLLVVAVIMSLLGSALLFIGGFYLMGTISMLVGFYGVCVTGITFFLWNTRNLLEE